MVMMMLYEPPGIDSKIFHVAMVISSGLGNTRTPIGTVMELLIQSPTGIGEDSGRL